VSSLAGAVRAGSSLPVQAVQRPKLTMAIKTLFMGQK